MTGRPTEYNEEYLEKTKSYLKNYKKFHDAIPSVAGLAVALGVARSTIYYWSGQEDKRAFSDILENILSSQEKILINNGLTNVFNSNITKLVLGKHGYKEKSDITTNDKEITATPEMVALSKELEQMRDENNTGQSS